MKTIPVSAARTKIFHLLDEAAEGHEPILVLGKRNNAVLISEDDWNSIQETLYILSVPGMRDVIREASETPLSDYIEENKLPW